MESDGENVEREQDWELLFQRLDQDSNGELDEAEVANALAQMKYPSSLLALSLRFSLLPCFALSQPPVSVDPLSPRFLRFCDTGTVRRNEYSLII